MRAKNMRRLLASLVVSTLLLGMMLTLAPRMEAQGSAPNWSVGNYWNYSGEMTSGPNTVNMTMKMYVNKTVSVTVGLNSYTTWEVLEWMNMSMTVSPNPTLYMNMTGREYLQTSDFAMVKTNASMPNPMPPPQTIWNETTYEPPQKNFKFPLTNGDKWTSTSKVNSTVNGSPSPTRTQSWYYNVSGPHSITISGLGTFNTFNVTQNESGATEGVQAWYSDTVGNYVRMVVSSSGQLITIDLHDYSYVANQPPLKPTIAITPSAIYRGTSVTFTAASTDPDGDTVSYAWEFGDGATSNTNPATHSYTSLGTYTVNVTASDGKGGSARNSTTVTVVNRPPGEIALTFAPTSPEVDTNVTFVALAVDPDLETLTYSWKFGDGATGTGATVNHAYSAKGDFTVNVTASDGHGGYSWKEVTVTVKEKAAGISTEMLIIIIVVIIVVILIIVALAVRSRRKAGAKPPAEPPPEPPAQP